ncbi:hypothetical protein MA16_Dca009823 [Dendrobium catenatum]|uniref:Uncharacterized protein n=1 Tax=Dendrobium catenatum TaxID=906689 RepID=A0A2I0XIB6_9ASPA|nr:hypothetical protein MA16_Dca009823 [Dendrobium catenatum]
MLVLNHVVLVPLSLPMFSAHRFGLWSKYLRKIDRGEALPQSFCSSTTLPYGSLQPPEDAHPSMMFLPVCSAAATPPSMMNARHRLALGESGRVDPNPKRVGFRSEKLTRFQKQVVGLNSVGSVPPRPKFDSPKQSCKLKRS